MQKNIKGVLVYRVVFIVIVMAGFGGFVLFGNAAGAGLSDQVRDQLRSRLDGAGCAAEFFRLKGLICEPSVIRDFYERRSFRPAWTADDGPLPHVEPFLQAVRQADQEGLRPADYHLFNIQEALKEIQPGLAHGGPLDPERLADLDLVLTDAFLVYASHLLAGRLNPVTIHPEWHVKGQNVDVVAVLESALETGQMEKVLRGLSPAHPGYLELRQALASYRTIAREGGWPIVPAGPKMRRGDIGARVRLLRKRLAVTGDLVASQEGDQQLFDSALDQAVRRFQARCGLDVDGVVGRLTLAALNVPADERVRQIEVNMERWRWLPEDLGRRFLLVNIAAFRLEVMENDRAVMTMRVIVGKRYQHTPVFIATMTYLVFNPYWNVPRSIAVKEIIPLIAKDPGYLARNHLKVFERVGSERKEVEPEMLDRSKLMTAEHFPYSLRQEAGPWNALGRVKFMFPNAFNVYLHDTPERGLFARTVRGLSHGCIRIEKPIELAEYLLRDAPRWTKDAILAAIDTSVDRTVPLPQPIPVYILYWTAWVDQNGSVQFRNDIYERDLPLRAALDASPPTNNARFPHRHAQIGISDSSRPRLLSCSQRPAAAMRDDTQGDGYPQPCLGYAGSSWPPRDFSFEEGRLWQGSGNPK
jgi:murein L,D-transpeptidase YcbB/YkuD